MLRFLLLGALLPLCAGDLFTCPFSGFTLRVLGPPAFLYTLSTGGAPWLEGGTLSLLRNGAYLFPGAGLTAGAPVAGAGVDELGAYTFLSIPWSAAPGALIVANFTCYGGALAALSLHFPGGYSFGGSLGAAAAARFPLFFAAGENSTLLSPALGFIEWAGEMDSYANAHGVGMRGFGGGTQSGPLLLFNASELVPGAAKPHALVLGPGGGAGTHVAHGVVNLLPAAAPPAAPVAAAACGDPASWAPHTDEVGANAAPGFEGGVLVAAGQPAACCAKCAAAGPSVCDSWVFDTDGTAGGANCWPLLGIRGSKQAGDRVLGVMAPPACDAPTPAAAPAAATPADGFESGLGNSTEASCCAVCGALGGACAAWAFDAPSATCFPLKAAAGSAPAAPGRAWARKKAPSMWLAAGVQGEIASLPPRFTSKWLLVGSATGINDAVMAYGGALKAAAPGGGRKLQKEEDALRNLPSFWSDNGAIYFDG
jgi:hypothetical protein